jgi:riboflavin kinase
VGRGRWFLGLDRVTHQIRATLGFDAYKNTLNVHLDAEARRFAHACTTPRPGTPFTPMDTPFASGTVFKIQLNGRLDGALVFPLIPQYLPNQREIVAFLNLREALGVHDGDEVIVEIGEP